MAMPARTVRCLAVASAIALVGARGRAAAQKEPALRLDPSATATEASFDAKKGTWSFGVTSQFQRRENTIEVLLTDSFDRKKAYRTLYVLPVNEGLGGRWGDCLQVVRTLGAHNEHDLICVTMAFDTSPWYGAHATDRVIRHEEYLLKVVVPLVEQRYPVRRAAADRLLVGFSKSGWGAFLLIMRNPRVLGYACSWDAPLMMDVSHLGIFETKTHYGTKENFARYLPSVWARTNAKHFAKEKRLVLLGHNFFGNRWACEKDKPHTATFHALLDRLGIAHHYDNSVSAAHSWNPRWMKPAIEALVEISRPQDRR